MRSSSYLVKEVPSNLFFGRRPRAFGWLIWIELCQPTVDAASVDHCTSALFLESVPVEMRAVGSLDICGCRRSRRPEWFHRCRDIVYALSHRLTSSLVDLLRDHLEEAVR